VQTTGAALSPALAADPPRRWTGRAFTEPPHALALYVALKRQAQPSSLCLAPSRHTERHAEPKPQGQSAPPAFRLGTRKRHTQSTFSRIDLALRRSGPSGTRDSYFR